MISPYKGEFLINPIPLELDLNYCSHSCAYCFANLNNPNRKADLNKIINQIRNAHNSNSLTSYLINNKYPILISNKIDPFAKSNYKVTLPLLEILKSKEIPVAFQTKGGDGIDEALQIIDKSAFYISISFLNDELRKKIEPASPSIDSRFELISKLKEKGHSVSVGINPVIPQWLNYDEYDILLDKLKSLGVNNIWLETLHLNKKQIDNLSKREIDAIGQEVLEISKKRHHHNLFTKHLVNYTDIAIKNGFNQLTGNQPFYSEYWNDTHEVYKGKTLKTYQDFINYCFTDVKDGAIDFDEFYNFIKKDYYEIEFSGLDGFVYNIGRNHWRRDADKMKNLKTFKDLLVYFWNTPEFSKSIFQIQLFKPYLNIKEKKFEVCDKNMHLAHFDGTNYKDNMYIIYNPN